MAHSDNDEEFSELPSAAIRNERKIFIGNLVNIHCETIH